MARHGREGQQVGLDSLDHIALMLGQARDAERLAKIRSGKLRVDDDELQAVLDDDAAADKQWDPYEDEQWDPHPERARHG